MHVLVLPSWYPTKARPHAGVYLREQAQALRQAGVRVGVIYPEQQSLRVFSRAALWPLPFRRCFYDEGGLLTLRQHGWNLLWRSPLRWRLRCWSAHQLARRYIARAGRPDLVHAHSARWAAAAAARIQAAWAIPYVVTEHYSGFLCGDISTAERRWARRGFRSARRVVAVSEALRRALTEQRLVQAGRVSMLPDAVDAAFFRLPPAPRPAAPFRFAALGHLTPVKGLDVLLRAFAQAFQGAPGVELIIGGDGPERGALERQAAALGLQRQVQFRGALDRAQVRRLFWDACAFVLPSRHETFGVALAEAMATGLPAVATACGGPEDIVTPETGLLVPPGNVLALAAALRTLRRRSPSNAAAPPFNESAIRAYIVEQFSARAITPRLIALYREACST